MAPPYRVSPVPSNDKPLAIGARAQPRQNNLQFEAELFDLIDRLPAGFSRGNQLRDACELRRRGLSPRQTTRVARLSRRGDVGPGISLSSRGGIARGLTFHYEIVRSELEEMCERSHFC